MVRLTIIINTSHLDLFLENLLFIILYTSRIRATCDTRWGENSKYIYDYCMLFLYVYPFQRIQGPRACAKLLVAGVDHTDRVVHLRNIAYFSIEHLPNII